MKRNQTAIRIPGLLLVALLGMGTFPAMGVASEDSQAERDARREQERGRRDMEDRERAQAEALRGQEAALQRMDATRSRIEANTQQISQQLAEQARNSSYPYSTSVAPVVLVVPPVTNGVATLPVQPRYDDAVSGMNFAPLTERLKSYFGAQSGVLVVSAGAGAPFGLQDGDVIISIDGRVPTDGPHVAGILRSYKSGERLKLKVQRDRKTIDIDTHGP